MTRIERRPCDRRQFLLVATSALAGSAIAAPARAIVTMLGDSITAGYGLPAKDAVPAQLERALQRMGLDVAVRAAGVSGDTSAGGLARADFSVQPDTDVCVVALGGNDLLQGLDPKATQRNLGAIVQRLKARNIGVVIAGLRAPPVIGRAYALEFGAVFHAVARQYDVPLYPDLLAGVAGIAELNQKDRIHPNANGAKIIAAGLAVVVAKRLHADR